MAVYGGNAPIDFTAVYLAPSGTSLALDFQTDLTQRVFVDGLSSHTSGFSTVENKAQGCTAIGVAAPSISAHKIELQTRYVTTYSWADSRVGDPRVTNAQKAVAVGFDASVVPSHKIVISFYREPSGAALAFNFADAYTPVSGSAVPAEFSRTISFWPIAPSGIAAPSVGSHDVSHSATSAQVVYAESVAISYPWGNSTVFLNSRFVLPTGVPSQLTYGSARIEYKNKVVTPSGIGATTIGSPTVLLFTRYVTLSGIAATGYGSSSITNAINVAAPIGFVASAYGTSALENKNKNPIPTGFDSATFGTQWVSNKTRTLAMTGESLALFGTQWVSNNIRNVSVTGFNAGVLGYPVPLLQHRNVYPHSFLASTISSTTSIFLNTRYIKPSGLVASVFGQTRISTIISELSVAGVDLFRAGNASVQLFNRTVEPSGFIGSTGTLRISNFRQYVYPTSVGLKGIGYPLIMPQLKLTSVGSNTALFGNQVVTNSIQDAAERVYASGFYSESFGTSLIERVEIVARQMNVTGMQASYVSTGLIVNTSIYTAGGLLSKYGAHRLSNGLRAQGYSENLIGVPTIGATKTNVFARSIFDDIFGEGMIAYKLRNIEPSWSDAGFVGAPVVKNGLYGDIADTGEAIFTKRSTLVVRNKKEEVYAHV